MTWDEGEQMFEAISKPPKRIGMLESVEPFVRVLATHQIELDYEKAPSAGYGFLMLAHPAFTRTTCTDLPQGL